MNVTLLSFSLDIGEVLDVDFRLTEGSRAAAFGDEHLSIQGFGKRQILMGPLGPAELPKAWPASEFPHLRSIGSGRLLLIDTSSAHVKDDNAFLLTESGRLEARFHVGAGVIDVVPTAGAVAVAYHPDAAHEYGLETGPMAATSIAVFDINGRVLATLNHDLERMGWSASNVQCMTARESGELVFIPEFLKTPKAEFDSPIVFYNWRTGHAHVEESSVLRPLAISSRDSSLMIYSPETSEDELLICDLHGRKVKSLGFHPQIFRGLLNGKFLSQVSGTQYRILDPFSDAHVDGPAFEQVLTEPQAFQPELG